MSNDWFSRGDLAGQLDRDRRELQKTGQSRSYSRSQRIG